MDFKGIAHLLSQEHPQTVAVALARLQSDHASEVIERLPQQMQADVISRIATLNRIDPEVLLEIDELIDSMLGPAINKFLRGT